MTGNGNGTVAEEERAVDAATLRLLLAADAGLWSEEEVLRALDLPGALVADAFSRLASAGLIHRLSGFVWPTRSAVHAARLTED